MTIHFLILMTVRMLRVLFIPVNYVTVEYDFRWKSKVDAFYSWHLFYSAPKFAIRHQEFANTVQNVHLLSIVHQCMTKNIWTHTRRHHFVKTERRHSVTIQSTSYQVHFSDHSVIIPSPFSNIRFLFPVCNCLICIIS